MGDTRERDLRFAQAVSSFGDKQAIEFLQKLPELTSLPEDKFQEQLRILEEKTQRIGNLGSVASAITRIYFPDQN